MCKVVHFKKDNYDIYIGRLPNDEYNKWSYPKCLSEQMSGVTRTEKIDAYEDYLINNEELMNNLHELKYKTLGCWCKDKGGGGKKCHGDIIKKYVDKLELKDKQKNLNCNDWDF